VVADVVVERIRGGAEGEARLELRFGRLRATAADPAHGVVEYDSDAPPPPARDVRRRLPAESWLAGCTFQLTCSTRGDVLAVTGVDAAVKGAVERSGGDAALAADAADALTAARLRDLTGWMFGPAPFPAAAVPAGSRWSHRDPVPAIAGRFRVMTTWFHRFGAERPDEVVVESSGGVSASSRDPALASGAVTGGKCTGSGVWSRGDGLPVRWTAEAAFVYDVPARAGGEGHASLSHTTRLHFERAAAAPAAPPPRAAGALDLRAPPGLQHRYTLAISASQTVGGGAKDDVTQTTWSTEVSVKGLPDGPAGERRVEFRLGRMRGTLVNRLLGRVAYDSASIPGATAIDRRAWSAGTALSGCVFQLTVDAAGRIAKVDGLDDALATARRRCAADRDLAAAVAPFVGEAAVRSLAGWVLAATPYPHEALAAGLSWEDRDREPGGGPDVVATHVWSHRVASLDARNVTLESTGTVEVSGTHPLVAAGRVASSSARGTSRIARDDGLPLEATTESEFAVESSSGSLRRRTTTVLTATK
jgi:hypothetical protein